MSFKQKETYLKDHLFNELRWLLNAATEWKIQVQLNLKLVGYDIQVYAMDSALLHARSLFEFFVGKTTNNHYGCEEFLGPGILLTSSKYTDWAESLHTFLMHVRDRSNPKLLDSSGVRKHLKEMPVDFAIEILTCWKEFERLLANSGDPQIQTLASLAREKRRDAIKSAECVANSPVAQQHAKERGQPLKPVFAFD